MKVACSEVKKGKLADVDVHAGRTTKLVYGNRSTSDVLRQRQRPHRPLLCDPPTGQKFLILKIVHNSGLSRRNRGPLIVPSKRARIFVDHLHPGPHAMVSRTHLHDDIELKARLPCPNPFDELRINPVHLAHLKVLTLEIVS